MRRDELIVLFGFILVYVIAMISMYAGMYYLIWGKWPPL